MDALIIVNPKLLSTGKGGVSKNIGGKKTTMENIFKKSSSIHNGQKLSPLPESVDYTTYINGIKLLKLILKKKYHTQQEEKQGH